MIVGGLNLAHLFVIIGCLLVISEAFIPGADMMVFGTALLIGGLVGMQTGLGAPLTPANVLYLTIISVIAGGITFYFYRTYLRGQGEGSETTTAEDLKDKEGTTVNKVTRSSGRIHLDAGSRSEYQARSVVGDIEPQTDVVVVDPGGGTILKVRPTEKETTQIPEEDAQS